MPTIDQLSSREIARRSKSSFLYSFSFLPREKREAIYSIYAFCRHSDDIVDQESPVSQRTEELARWRADVGECYTGTPKARQLKELADTVQKFSVPESYLNELIDGVEMDLTLNRYATFQELYSYCYRVASIVGLMCIEIFGYSNPKTKLFAEHLGIALQLTNIVRDIGADAELGRIYLPQEDLARFSVSEEQLLKREHSSSFVDLASFQAQRAAEFYTKALGELPEEDRKGMLPAEIMATIYRELLEDLRKAQFRVFGNRVSVPSYRKVFLAFRAWARNRSGR